MPFSGSPGGSLLENLGIVGGSLRTPGGIPGPGCFCRARCGIGTARFPTDCFNRSRSTPGRGTGCFFPSSLQEGSDSGWDLRGVSGHRAGGREAAEVRPEFLNLTVHVMTEQRGVELLIKRAFQGIHVSSEKLGVHQQEARIITLLPHPSEESLRSLVPTLGFLRRSQGNVLANAFCRRIDPLRSGPCANLFGGDIRCQGTLSTFKGTDLAFDRFQLTTRFAPAVPGRVCGTHSISGSPVPPVSETITGGLGIEPAVFPLDLADSATLPFERLPLSREFRSAGLQGPFGLCAASFRFS